MVRAIDPDWDLQATGAEERGHTAVYRVEVDTGEAVESFVLKATPDGRNPEVAKREQTDAALPGTENRHLRVRDPTVCPSPHGSEVHVPLDLNCRVGPLWPRPHA